MSRLDIRIDVYCRKEMASITSALKQVNIEGYNISISYPDKPELNDAIIIVQETSLEAPIIDFLLKNGVVNNKVIFIIPEDDALFISSLIKAGFSSFFILPFEYYKFINYVSDLILESSFQDKAVPDPGNAFDKIIGNSREIKKIIELSRKVADKRNINILITGETGTGKGLLAHAIHNCTSNESHPYVDITCTAIPETLLESELFGYEPGAFTNAKVLKPGLFELAENGTLFLDEIGDLSLTIQSKLLRTIEKKVIRRLGGVVDIPISARIISATNKNLEQQIENNSFRRDLFHRLNTVSIELPPLRQRGSDIMLLVNYFISHFNQIYKKDIKKIEPGLKDFMNNYSWPGNIRELRNNIERAILLSEDGNTLRMKNFVELTYERGDHDRFENSHPLYINLSLEYEKVNLKNMEKIYAKETLDKLKGNKSKTAKMLGISRPKLDALLKN